MDWHYRKDSQPSVLIKKGHRIRIVIAGADKDTFVRSPAEGTPEITVGAGALSVW